ncbi:hypothetical protein QE453_002256 [Agrobacterium sp. SORGH_AS440]|nr:hypothetical protein [Agrobacterium sp. SORGH_AS_0440]
MDYRWIGCINLDACRTLIQSLGRHSGMVQRSRFDDFLICPISHRAPAARRGNSNEHIDPFADTGADRHRQLSARQPPCRCPVWWASFQHAFPSRLSRFIRGRLGGTARGVHSQRLADYQPAHRDISGPRRFPGRHPGAIRGAAEPDLRHGNLHRPRPSAADTGRNGAGRCGHKRGEASACIQGRGDCR